MKTQDLAVIGGSALATLTAVLVVCWPVCVVAKGERDEIKPLIRQPLLKTQGCEVSLRTTQETYKAGDAPVLELTGYNPGDQPAQLTVTVQMMGQPGPAGEMSRSKPMPKSLWSQPCTLALQPHARSLYTLRPGVFLAANQGVYFVMQTGNTAVATPPRPVSGPTAPIPAARPTTSPVAPAARPAAVRVPASLERRMPSVPMQTRPEDIQQVRVIEVSAASVKL